MNQYQNNHQLFCFAGQAVKHQHQRRQRKNQDVPDSGAKISDPQQLPVIVVRRFNVPCSHALADHCDKGIAEGDAEQGGHRPEALSHAIGGNLYRAKQSYDAGQRHLGKLEQAVFYAAGNGDAQNTPHHPAVPGKDLPEPEVQRVVLPEGQRQHDNRRECTGNQRWHRYACHASMEDKNADSIAHYIDAVHGDGDVHDGACLVHTAK